MTSFKVNVNPLLNQLLKASQQRAADQEMFDLSTDQLEASCKVNWKSEFRTNISILVKTAVHDMLHQSRISKFNEFLHKENKYLAHVIEQPNFRIPNPQYLQRNFCFDFFNDSENTF